MSDASLILSISFNVSQLIFDVWIWSDVKHWKNSNHLCAWVCLLTRCQCFSLALYIAIFPCSFSLHRQMITKTLLSLSHTLRLGLLFVFIELLFEFGVVFLCVHFEMVMAYRFNSIKCASFTPFFLAFRLRLSFGFVFVPSSFLFHIKIDKLSV